METTLSKPAPRRKPLSQMPNQLRFARVSAGYSLDQIAEIIGVSRQAVHEAETKGTGIGEPKWELLNALFEYNVRLPISS